jgi:PAS domain S-box-containing protein
MTPTREAIPLDNLTLRHLADALPQIVWSSRPDGTSDYFNERWYELFGTSRDVIGEAAWLHVLHPDDRGPCVERWLRAIATGEAYESEYRLFDRSRGSYRWFIGRALPVKDASGAVVRWFGTCTDIDDQKRAAAELSKIQAHTMFDASPLPLWVHDAETLAFLAANDAALHQYGYTREELLRMTIHDIRSPDAASGLAASLAPGGNDSGVPDGGWLQRGTWTHRRKDGIEIEVEVANSPIVFQGRPAVLVLGVDVTERRRAERAQRESEEKLRQITDNIQEVFWMSDPELREIQFVSPAYERIWGRTCASLCASPMSWAEAIDPADRPQAVAEMLAAHRRGEPADITYRIHRPDGTVRWIRDRSFPVRDARGDVVRYVGSASDVTELHDAHEQLKTTQKHLVQQERLGALGQMASGIAHDFNNALTPIVGFSEMLLDPAHPLDERETRRFLRTIHTAARDGARIVSRLKEFYRPRDPDEVFHPVDVDAVVEQTIALTQPRWKEQAQASGIAIDLRSKLRARRPVLGNASDLRELLTNLIFNAIDALPAGGTIEIRTREDGREIVLDVTDTGVGMSEEVQRRCLEPFFTTKGSRGTGLGLAMVHGIVRRHEGTIAITSAPGCGTTFTIRLPALSTAAIQSGQLALRAPTRPLKILVVEDEPEVRDVVQSFLKLDGHTVALADDGRKALATFLSTRFDLVLTDRAMPEMSGDSLAAAIRAISPTTPVVLVTGFGDFMKSAGEVPPGIVGIVSKPMTQQSLREAIASAVA